MTKNGGGLLGAPVGVEEWKSVEARWMPVMVRLAAWGLTGTAATLGYTVVKIAYCWPVLQASFSTQFPCLY